MSKLTIKCITVNEPKGSSYTLYTSYTTLYPENIDDRHFQFSDVFTLTHHHKKIKNYPK